MVPADAFPEGWPSCNPSFVLEALGELEKEVCPQEKKFYSTYPTKWEKLDMEKRQKTFVFFAKLDSSVKTSVSAKATEKEKTATSAAKAESFVTTKHDRTRVLHLFADPKLVLDWQEAYSGAKDVSHCLQVVGLRDIYFDRQFQDLSGQIRRFLDLHFLWIKIL